MDSVRILGKYQQAAGGAGIAVNNYRGLEIHALYTESHEKIAACARELLHPGDEILDLGSGTGALCLRLQDVGFGVTGCDAVRENFRLHDKVAFVCADLNAPFSQDFDRSFDAITATEIIEHLENPRHFIRQCRKLLKPGGKLILSTPNIDSAISRATYVRTGNFRMFSEDYYRGDGHITPISRQLLACALAEAQMRLLGVYSVGKLTFPPLAWLRMRALAAMLKIVSERRDEQGDILIVTAEKAE